MKKAKGRWVEGVVPIDLSDFINCDLEGILDIMSERLTGSGLLSDISYEVVGHRKDELHIKVAGSAELILDH